MKSPYLILSALAIGLPLFGATPNSASVATSDATVQNEWLRLDTAVADSASLPTRSDQDKQVTREALTALADRVKGFYAGHPDAEKASAARQIEALLLMRAAELGAVGLDTRLATSVATVRSDAKLPAYDRYVVASRANEVALRSRSGLGRGALLAGYEQSARQMIAEFPDQAEPYQALVALADDQSDVSHGLALAQEVANSAAPAAIKSDAQRLADRLALVGTAPGLVLPLGESRTYSLGDSHGKPVVIYTWSMADERSLKMARWLKDGAGEQVSLIGINLDHDSAAASAQAGKLGLAASQVYSPEGMQSPWAQQLHFSASGTIYLFDTGGVLRDVHGERQFQAKLATLKKGGAL